MKTTIIKSTVMIMAILAVSLTTSAQVSQQYNADIPFAFEARGQQHPAGKYRLVSVSMNAPGGIVLQHVEGKTSAILGIASGMGTNNWDVPGTLTFLNVDGKYRLSEISTATFKLRMKVTRTAIRDGDNVALAKRAVKVQLN